MQPFLLVGIIVLATLGNLAPLLIGIARTPPDSVFLATTHHPADYFYYLSQFAQGAYRWITTIDLYTSEAIAPSLVGWSNVLLGRLGGIFGIPHVWAYHASVLFFTVILLYAAYRTALHVLKNTRAATVALFLFALFHAFPVFENGSLSYADYWNNLAIPSVRLGTVPHQLLTTTLSLLPLLTNSHLVRVAAGAGLASMQPVLWVVMTASAALSRRFSMAILLFIGGVTPAFYLSRLFGTQPFLQLKVWEAIQQNALTLWGFMLATGPIFLLALFFIPAFIKTYKKKGHFFVILPLLSIFLFLSPAPSALGLSHVRFMSPLVIFCVSLIAAHGLMSLKKTGLFILFLLTILLIPNHIKTITINTNIDTTNAYYYLPKDDFALLQRAAAVSTPDEVFFVSWPFNVVFPGIAGRKSFNGHPLLTIDAQTKDTAAEQFLTHDFLSAYNISYVITYPIPDPPPFLSPIQAGGSLIIYKVAL